MFHEARMFKYEKHCCVISTISVFAMKIKKLGEIVLFCSQISDYYAYSSPVCSKGPATNIIEVTKRFCDTYHL